MCTSQSNDSDWRVSAVAEITAPNKSVKKVLDSERYFMPGLTALRHQIRKSAVCNTYESLRLNGQKQAEIIGNTPARKSYVPKVEKGRYYSVQLADLYSYNVGYIGSRATGNDPGCYRMYKADLAAAEQKVVRTKSELEYVALAKFALGMAIIVGVPPLSRRLRLPAVVGLLLSGVVIGPHVLGVFAVHPSMGRLLR
jgi:hypothetical protein